MLATYEYRFEVRNAREDSEWVPTTEEFVCEALRLETPDARDLNDILIAMRNGAEADSKGLVFRAVPITHQEQP